MMKINKRIIAFVLALSMTTGAVASTINIPKVVYAEEEKEENQIYGQREWYDLVNFIDEIEANNDLYPLEELKEKALEKLNAYYSFRYTSIEETIDRCKNSANNKDVLRHLKKFKEQNLEAREERHNELKNKINSSFYLDEDETLLFSIILDKTYSEVTRTLLRIYITELYRFLKWYKPITLISTTDEVPPISDDLTKKWIK